MHPLRKDRSIGEKLLFPSGLSADLRCMARQQRKKIGISAPLVGAHVLLLLIYAADFSSEK